eukprot:PITA_13260
MNSIYLVLSLAASFKWDIHQMDVKFVFLHGDFHEEIYMEQPSLFIQTDSNLVCWLKKSLYGLKQAPRAWYAKMDSLFLDICFSRCHSDNTVYTKKVGQSLISLVLYVDDLILTGSDPNVINHVKSNLKSAKASPLLVGFTDFDWAGDPNDQKSTASYVFTLGSGPITWAYKKQSVISLSSAEAEYHGTVEASKEAPWLCQILS